MAHIPHLYVPGAWDSDALAVTTEQFHHLSRVMRSGDEAPVSYTDGRGSVGTGTFTSQGVLRGPESVVGRPSPPVAVAVAPPHASDRRRYIVEKLSELGVDRLVWLNTHHGQARAPRVDKAIQWAIGALEQCRGAWLMEIEGECDFADLPATVWFAQQGGGPMPAATGEVTLAIGPEGGFSAEELARVDTTVGLGARVLRVETAAVVASGLVLHHLGRMNT